MKVLVADDHPETRDDVRAGLASGAGYVYDQAGRLVAVVSDAGEVARYGYDAVGNITSINREIAPAGGIIDVNPRGAAPGRSVTILGRGFGATASENAVTFNGVTASVQAAAADRLRVTVPPGASTGPVRVRTSGGNFTSPRPFVVPPGQPTINGFTPTIGSPGTTVTVTGGGFQSTLGDNAVGFGGSRATTTAASSTQLSAVVPAANGSGKITVATPYGAATSTTDLFVPPPGLTAADIGFTGRATVDGPVLAVNLGGKAGLVLVDGAAGQRISLEVTDGTGPGAEIQLLRPDGAAVASIFVGSKGFLDTTTLLLTGTYTILITPNGQEPGGLSVRLRDVPPDSTGRIAVDGQPVPVRLDVPGQNGTLTFAGTAGQLITVDLSENTIPGVDVWLRQPDGTVLASTSFSGETESLPSIQLPVAGDHSILIDPFEHRTGALRVAVRTAVSAAPPRAATGATALAGRTLRLDGVPLANVTLELEGQVATTDDTGRFLLTDVPAGRQVLVIRGETANRPDTRYGRFEYGLHIDDGRTNQLPFTIWMPALDTAHEVTIPVPTTEEVVLRTPAIPGLEVHLPAGTVIRDEQGREVDRLGITAIPIDQPPFPLPLLGVQVPIYFTVQPGGSIYPEGARIIYPNYTNAAPNRRVEFYNYDPYQRGWYIYGHGRVSADGTQVVPDPGVAVWEFTGAMFNAGMLPPPSAPPPSGRASGGDPVDCATGLFTATETDLTLPDDVMPLSITRTYLANDGDSRVFGIGATFPYQMFLWSAKEYEQVDLILPDGGRVHYVRTSPGTGFDDANFGATPTPSRFRDSTINRNNPRQGWDLRLTDGTTMFFPQYTPLTEIRDRFGNQLTITRNATTQITRITTPAGRWVTLDYDGADRITQITDNTGRTVGYAYDDGGRLAKVTDAAGRVRTYTYDAKHRMLTRTDPRGNKPITNTYDAKGRVTKQTLADGSSWQFAYTTDASGRITKTSVTDPRGTTNAFTFNAAGYAVTYAQAVGTAQERTTSYTRGPDQKITAVRDPLGRTTQIGYDNRGNPTTVVRLAGTAQAVTHSMAYESAFNQLTRYTDPLGHAWAFEYDGRGALTALTDPLGNRTTVATDQRGQPTKITDPLGRSWTVGYLLGDRTSSTDPLGRTSRRFLDSAGRVLGTTDPPGNVSRSVFDAVDQLVTSINPFGDSTNYRYDANGNLLSRTDARDGVTAYAYDIRNRIVSRTDPLNRMQQFSYDLGRNLTGHTDRRGTRTTLSYDPLDRLTSIAYGSSRTDAFAYDAADRLTTASSSPGSAAGTISRTYDALDRLTSEQAAQGTVNYGYDNANRRTSMTVAGQPTVTYSYDNANRLTGIGRGGAVVGIAWDVAGRRTSTTAPNGVTTGYAYDIANQLTAINYLKGAGTLGALNYDYDQTGFRERTGGSLATVDLPAAVSTTSYDAANQLTRWGTATLSYDANGNLTNDGTQTYTWDARNQLAKIDGPLPATFDYDPLGRRTKKTVGATDTLYIYDNSGNPVQELTGTSPAATVLTGLGMDEFYGRFDGPGANYFLTDAIGSTVALTNDTGITTRYGYQPFGAATTSGPVASNSYQFTGRENDGTGLYNHRARYYSPTLHRFISEDPIRTEDGNAFYSYAANNPGNFTDPTGLAPEWLKKAGIIAQIIYNVVAGGISPYRVPPRVFEEERRKETEQRTKTAPRADESGSDPTGVPESQPNPSDELANNLDEIGNILAVAAVATGVAVVGVALLPEVILAAGAAAAILLIVDGGSGA